jgi:ABC-type cobalamin/Fe3+-siderophores transport system ATPase subunit
MKSLIEIKNLKFSYEIKDSENNLSINNLNLTIENGEFVAILGKNGSGKSTLAKHLNSLLLPLSGEVIVDAIKMYHQNGTICMKILPEAIHRMTSAKESHSISYIPQPLRFLLFVPFPNNRVLPDRSYGCRGIV